MTGTVNNASASRALFDDINATIKSNDQKVTVDSYGRATSGTSIAAGDLPSSIDAAKIGSGAVSNTEFGYLDGVTSAIQTQLNGQVVGPASATDNAIARFDGTTGKLVQNSNVAIDDSGNVGIGSTVPAYNLDVIGNIAMGNNKAIYGRNSVGGATKILDTAGDVVTLGWNFDNYLVLQSGGSAGNNNSIQFKTKGAERVRIDSTGNVGIGTTSPGAKLEIAAPDDSVAPALSLRQSSNRQYGWDFLVDQLVDGKLYIQGVSPAVVNVMTLDRTTGNVGIGTTSPNATLEVAGSALVDSFSNNSRQIRLRNADASAAGGLGLFAFNPGGADNDGIAMHGQSALSLRTNAADRLRIDVNGNVGIGTTTPGAKLEIAAPDDSVAPALSLRQSADRQYGWDFRVDQLVDGKLYLQGVNPAVVNVMTLDRTTGKVGIGTSSPSEKLAVAGEIKAGTGADKTVFHSGNLMNFTCTIGGETHTGGWNEYTWTTSLCSGGTIPNSYTNCFIAIKGTDNDYGTGPRLVQCNKDKVRVYQYAGYNISVTCSFLCWN